MLKPHCKLDIIIKYFISSVKLNKKRKAFLKEIHILLQTIDNFHNDYRIFEVAQLSILKTIETNFNKNITSNLRTAAECTQAKIETKCLKEYKENITNYISNVKNPSSSLLNMVIKANKTFDIETLMKNFMEKNKYKYFYFYNEKKRPV